MCIRDRSIHWPRKARETHITPVSPRARHLIVHRDTRTKKLHLEQPTCSHPRVNLDEILCHLLIDSLHVSIPIAHGGLHDATDHLLDILLLLPGQLRIRVLLKRPQVLRSLAVQLAERNPDPLHVQPSPENRTDLRTYPEDGCQVFELEWKLLPPLPESDVFKESAVSLIHLLERRLIVMVP
eukprot:TRINITY_DN60984_c0_g1_i1.p1 TRINITY_DN60984_c0_g1~~TRINITY_DN60984_c0_g1_i1.p1  ORF type:complete len:182 (+),score=7.93 TRINITY_DN60984_c0_g1_i1:168-713(+)